MRKYKHKLFKQVYTLKDMKKIISNWIFRRAIRIVIREVRNDHSLYIGYQSNIAMAFYDEYRRARGRKRYLNLGDVHRIANNAAKNFLNLWTRK